MRRLIILLALLIILVISAAIGILSTAAETAVNRHYDYLEAPASATDMVMRSRETAPAEADNRGLLTVGFLAVAGGVIAGVVFLLHNGGEFLRQGRLTLRAWQRPASHSAPQFEQLPAGQYEDVPAAPVARRPPALPYHDVDYLD